MYYLNVSELLKGWIHKKTLHHVGVHPDENQNGVSLRSITWDLRKHSVLTLISLPLPNFPILSRLSIPLCNAITGNPPRSSSNVLNFDPLQTKSKEVLRSYLVYILEQRLSDPSVCDISELRSCVQILTNKGAVNPTNNSIYFTKKFGNTIDLARQLPSKKRFFLFPFLSSPISLIFFFLNLFTSLWHGMILLQFLLLHRQLPIAFESTGKLKGHYELYFTVRWIPFSLKRGKRW